MNTARRGIHVVNVQCALVSPWWNWRAAQLTKTHRYWPRHGFAELVSVLCYMMRMDCLNSLDTNRGKLRYIRPRGRYNNKLRLGQPVSLTHMLYLFRKQTVWKRAPVILEEYSAARIIQI